MLEIHFFKLGDLDFVNFQKITSLINSIDNSVLNAVSHDKSLIIDYSTSKYFSDSYVHGILSTQPIDIFKTVIRVGITQAPLEDNFFVRSVGSNCIALTLFQTKEIYTLANRTVEEYIVISLLPHILWTIYKSHKHTTDYLDLFHLETKGCIFDLTAYKPDKVFKIKKPQLDSECKSKLLEANIEPQIIIAIEAFLNEFAETKDVSEKIFFEKTSKRTPTNKTKLKAFLCHASGDKPAVRDLYNQLTEYGIDPWLDEEDLLPGQDWRLEIPKAVKSSDVVLVCLSNKSTNKAGYIQKEIKYALDVASEQPEDEIYIIPIRLEECDVPEALSRWHWVNLSQQNGFERLMRSLCIRAESKQRLQPSMKAI
ncbi:hypothetical protein BIU88_02600 [Chlorobaculum limnaeum]|uniref:TIR domain-containing protein n=1 Tax=Chlorobaculum limnaeum TaxID=274537 RepID=A0A1D8D6A9_CHLLM|nr:toll/interleukin-1 receptor domain-containing protein [Chlorobaculum limnaeum]AOS83129.1 hypothetical protein BIU88_02600 [Chlorobaculum limnaeum]